MYLRVIVFSQPATHRTHAWQRTDTFVITFAENETMAKAASPDIPNYQNTAMCC